MKVFIHNFCKGEFDLERERFSRQSLEGDREVYYICTSMILSKKPRGFTSLVLLNHTDCLSVVVLDHLKCLLSSWSVLPPLTLCLCWCSVLRADSTTINTFTAPLNPTFFPPHISFYCMAPVFCFHFLRISNKAFTSFRGGKITTLSSKFSGRSHRGGRGSLGGCRAFTPCRQGKNPYEVLSAGVYTVFSTLRRLSSVLGGCCGVIL